MKIFKLVACISSLMLLTTGCGIDSQSPEELIEKKPIYNETNKNLYEQVKQFFPNVNTSLALPSNSTQVGKINEVDLDNDGVMEVVAFEKRENVDDNKSEVGFLVLQRENNALYTQQGSSLIEGSSIEYANFYDLDNDGTKEIILLVKKDSKTNMYIYSYKDHKVQEPYKLNPTWIMDRSNLNDLKIRIGYLDDDDKLDIIMMHHDFKTNRLYISIANFDEYIRLVDFTKIENVKNTDNLNDLYSKIDVIANKELEGKSIKQKGIILDIPIIENNNYITQMIYIEDKKVKKAFRDDDKSIVKPYYIPTEDIDKDGVVDIPIINGSGNIYTQKLSTNISWYQWNGKTDDESNLVFTSQIYYNYQNNFKLLIPNNLVNKMYIEQDYVGNDILFKFYYYDIINVEPKSLFTIGIVKTTLMDDTKGAKSTNGSVIAQSSEQSYILYINDAKELEKLKLDAEKLKEYFSLIY